MVAMKDIRAFSRQIAERFKPRRIILFGSYAYGKPTEDSDVDLFVEMPYRGDEAYKAAEIRTAIPGTFAMDIIVRTPAEVRKRLAMEDWFIMDILEKGKVLYEATDSRMGGKGGRRFSHHGARGARAQRAEL